MEQRVHPALIPKMPANKLSKTRFGVLESKHPLPGQGKMRERSPSIVCIAASWITPTAPCTVNPNTEQRPPDLSPKDGQNTPDPQRTPNPQSPADLPRTPEPPQCPEEIPEPLQPRAPQTHPQAPPAPQTAPPPRASQTPEPHMPPESFSPTAHYHPATARPRSSAARPRPGCPRWWPRAPRGAPPSGTQHRPPRAPPSPTLCVRGERAAHPARSDDVGAARDPEDEAEERPRWGGREAGRQQRAERGQSAARGLGFAITP
ncbi:proline-rich protein HaeIII subfamily 1-like [Phaenicophaeus curvirostris]|uniref:proline-rich protein HaeIII subfamily 1-like n=1 Tax=Phaenicophaeus curvirostris TaxID=33595 RepID=UPI0037F0D2EB